MLLVEGIRKKLLAQRRDLFRQVAQTEEELRWFQRDIESEAEERGQEETMVRLLDRLDGRAKAEIEAIDRALFKLRQSGTDDASDSKRPFPNPGWRQPLRRPCVWHANRRRRARRR